MANENKKYRNWKNTRFASMAWLLIILVIVIAIILNLIIQRVDTSWDISAGKQFSLTSTTEDYLDDLDDRGVVVDFYLLVEMDDLATDFDSLILYRTLLAYDDHDCINLIDFNPNVDTDHLEEINPDNAYTLSTGDMIFVCGDNVRRVPGTSMYTAYLDNDITYEDFEGENLITGSIMGVAEGITPTVYFLSGHGEKSIDQYTTFINNLNNYNYSADTLNLSTTKEIPDDTALLLVCAPESDLTDEEAAIIEDYLEDGGNITLMMSPNSGTFAYTNFDKLMNEFDISMRYDRVRETDSANHISGDDTTVLCQLTEVAEDSTADDLTSALIGQGLYTYMPESRSFAYYPDNSYCTMESLITTYDTAIGEVYGGISDDPDDHEGELILSAYSSNEMYNSAKMVVFGNAEFLDDEHVTSETVIVPVYLLLSTISWMYDSDVDMSIDAKSTSFDYISLQSESFATTLIVILTLIPIIIMAVGIIIWARRRNS